MTSSKSPDVDLPEGWALAKMDDAGNWATGGTPSRKEDSYFSGDIQWVKSGDLNDGVVRNTEETLTQLGLDNSPAKLLPKGTLSVALYGATIGRLGVLGIEAATNQACANCRVDEEHFERWYLFYYLLAQRRSLVEAGQGGAQPNLTNGIVRDWPLPLPPLAEQRRIVAKVEALLERVSKARGRLDRVSEILKRFRQSILAAACSGRLTADWRLENPGVMPAIEMLADLKRTVALNLSKTRDRDLYDSMFDEFPPVEDAEDLPDTWLYCRVGHVGQVFNGSTPSRKEPKFWGSGFPWVSSGEVQNNIIRETREQITKKGFAETSRRLLPVGTVLIAMIGEGKTRGQSAILNVEATINQNMAAIDIRNGGVESKYLWYWFQFQYLLTRREGGGTGPQALNCQSVRELLLYLPPAEEQTEIVRRVENIFSVLGRIECRVADGQKRLSAATQSVLAKAFAGGLVESEAELARREGRDFEPASLLLERIAAERERRSRPTNARPKPSVRRKATRVAR